MQNLLSKPEDLMDAPTCKPLSRNQRPEPPNMSDGDVACTCTAPAKRKASLQILFERTTLAIIFVTATKPSHFAHFWKGAEIPLHLPHKMTIECPKVVRT